MSASAHSSAKQTAAHQSPHGHKEPAHPSPAAHSPSSHAPPTAQKELEGRSDAPKTKAKKSQAVTRALGFWANQAEVGSKSLAKGNAPGDDRLGTKKPEHCTSKKGNKEKSKGGRYNVDLCAVNNKHRGLNRQGTREDPARISNHNGGDNYKISRETEILSDDGKPLTPEFQKRWIPAGKELVGQAVLKKSVTKIKDSKQKEVYRQRINAGAIKKIGKPTYVFVFSVPMEMCWEVQLKDKETGELRAETMYISWPASGWVDVSCFGEKKEADEIKKIQRKIKKNISRERKDNKIKTKGKKWDVQPVKPPNDEVAKLHTCKNQEKGANLAEDYFATESSGFNSVLLLVNLPGTSRDQFGVGLDLISKGAIFQQAKGTKVESVDLYECKKGYFAKKDLRSLYKNTKRPVTKESLVLKTFTNKKKGKLKFLFGKITRPEVSDYEYSYGWINRACLK